MWQSRQTRVGLVFAGVIGMLGPGAAAPPGMNETDTDEPPLEERATGPTTTSPAPPAQRQALQLFPMFNPTPMVLRTVQQLGFEETMVLITKHRFFDLRGDRFDYAKYQKKIWTPDREIVPGAPWPQFGVRPGYRGWVNLDFERWQPILEPERFSEHEIARRVDDYKRLIAATRQLRPGTKISMHGLVKGDLTGRRGKLIEEISSLCDAVSPSMYLNLGKNGGGFEQGLDMKRQRLRSALELKRRHGVKVFAAVWKRYRLKRRGELVRDERGRCVRPLLTPEQMRSLMDVIFSAEHEGLRVDGVIVWAGDNRILARGGSKRQAIPGARDAREAGESDVLFCRIIAESAAEHGFLLEKQPD